MTVSIIYVHHLSYIQTYLCEKMLVPKVPGCIKYFHMSPSGEMVAKMHKPAGIKHLSRDRVDIHDCWTNLQSSDK